ncbi:hypothetical protein BDR26DRAFT_864918 [Obelidium mucronatum]|nr:hypothetical protein BDR26DRAFT_864918 [Obelidium mucronatum]
MWIVHLFFFVFVGFGCIGHSHKSFIPESPTQAFHRRKPNGNKWWFLFRCETPLLQNTEQQTEDRCLTHPLSNYLKRKAQLITQLKIFSKAFLLVRRNRYMKVV